jgi:hypothetical protein
LLLDEAREATRLGACSRSGSPVYYCLEKKDAIQNEAEPTA